MTPWKRFVLTELQHARSDDYEYWILLLGISWCFHWRACRRKICAIRGALVYTDIVNKKQIDDDTTCAPLPLLSI